MNWLIGIDPDGRPVAIPTDRIVFMRRIEGAKMVVSFHEDRWGSAVLSKVSLVTDEMLIGVLDCLEEPQAQPPTVLWPDILVVDAEETARAVFDQWDRARREQGSEMEGDS